MNDCQPAETERFPVQVRGRGYGFKKKSRGGHRASRAFSSQTLITLNVLSIKYDRDYHNTKRGIRGLKTIGRSRQGTAGQDSTRTRRRQRRPDPQMEPQVNFSFKASRITPLYSERRSLISSIVASCDFLSLIATKRTADRSLIDKEIPPAASKFLLTKEWKPEQLSGQRILSDLLHKGLVSSSSEMFQFFRAKIYIESILLVYHDGYDGENSDINQGNPRSV